MLKATIDAEIFRESIDAIAALVTECRLHTAEDQIRTRSVDTANVAMVSLELQSTAFNSFSATTGELGLDIAKMKNIIGMMGKGDALTLNLLDEERKLELSFGGYRYSISLLDVNTIRKDPNPPGIDLPGKAVVPGDALNNAIKAAAVISDKIALGIDPDAMTFYMEAEGDTDHIKLALGEDELVALNPVRARSLFSIDYLKDMGRVMARADEVEVYLGIDHPVRFVFDIADGNGRVEYLLAPRIEAD
ncbi:DNA polymerase sliding clamp [Methanoculleus chikugoensis]|uniref:DNA polymerase sliding clamp n=1 Tax=Methanoculleus chikugoensis TaxID=118126 RepID=A0ABN5XKJ0_9EURY|nr:DNA polymerase sliding clamp [Methanoculleus chikugoensis]BBL68471.1 DNA polymerase III sliding clamp [Methanoculleus chikugoensis]